MAFLLQFIKAGAASSYETYTNADAVARNAMPVGGSRKLVLVSVCGLIPDYSLRGNHYARNAAIHVAQIWTIINFIDV